MDIFLITCSQLTLNNHDSQWGSYHATLEDDMSVTTIRDFFFAIVIDSTGLPTTSLCNNNNSLAFNVSKFGGSPMYFSSFFSNFIPINFKGIFGP